MWVHWWKVEFQKKSHIIFITPVKFETQDRLHLEYIRPKCCELLVSTGYHTNTTVCNSGSTIEGNKHD